MLSLNNTNFNRLERTVDAAALRQKVIANNIANVDTPYFKRSEVQFENLLQNEVNNIQLPFVGTRTDPRHFVIGSSSPQAQPQIETSGDTLINNNLNNVDIDSEMSLMAKNELRYNTLIQQVNYEFKQLHTAIKGV